MDFKRNGTMPDYVSCPFCQETDFDLIGLKHHFGAGHCDVWNEIPPPPVLRPRGLPANARVIATCDLSTTAQETVPAPEASIVKAFERSPRRVQETGVRCEKCNSGSDVYPHISCHRPGCPGART